MKRVFHRRFTSTLKCSIVVFALLAFYFFWFKMALAALLVSIAIVLMTERLLHTVYTFDVADGVEVLVIDRGRFSKTVTVRIDEVVKLTSVKVAFGLSHYLLLEYGNGHLVSLQPDNEERFRGELAKRLNDNDEK